MTPATRIVALVAAAAVLGGGATAYLMTADPPAAEPVAVAAEPVTLRPGPRLLAVTDRHLSAVPLAAPGGARSVAAVECVRAYAAAGTGVCLQPATPWSYRLVVLDAELGRRAAFEVPGQPSRARVSASGRMVAWTMFVGGDSYTTSGFSTRTGILDTRTGQRVDTLEGFAVSRDGKSYRNPDVNFWGVTFGADDDLFYATMSTRGRRFLVRGAWGARTVTTVAENVECPSLSPDGGRVAFKRAIGGDPRRGWRLSTMDLATGRVTATAEPAGVDDQAAWLDGDTLAYTRRRDDGIPDVWTVPADGSGAPLLLMPGAESPSPLR